MRRDGHDATAPDASRISLGIIGCGAVTHTNYAMALRGRDEYHVAFVSDLDDAQASSAARLFACEAVATDELIERADVIVVATPPTSHASLVRKGIARGKPVICEKPFVTSYSEARAVVDDAQQAGTRLYVGHFRRTYPQVELTRELVRLGVVGEVVAFSVREGGRFTWRAVSNYTMEDRFGGVLWDTGSHTLDMALFASGLDDAELADVHDVAVARDRSEPSHDLTATFTIATGPSSHVVGSAELSRTRPLPNTVEIRGTKGTLSFLTDLDNRVRLTTPNGSTVLTSDRRHDDLLECVDLQFRRLLLRDGDADFTASRFLIQMRLLEALTDA